MARAHHPHPAAGFASTIFAPLTSALAARLSGRGVLLVFALVLAVNADRAADTARTAAGPDAPLRAGIIDASYDSMPQILQEAQAAIPGLVIHRVEASVPEQFQQ